MMQQSLSFDARRRQMVEDQLRPRGIRDERVLAAMSCVPREAFVGKDWIHDAYDDCALPIAGGQTISQPYTVAYMCEAAAISPSDRVLEIGTGSGYCAAVLSHLAREVYTVERLPKLAAEARRRLSDLGYGNVHVATANGSLGLPANSPYDAILVTAAAVSLPQALVEQLAPGGRIVIPIGDYDSGQTMYRFTRRESELTAEDLGAFAFVPLIGAYTRRDLPGPSINDNLAAGQSPHQVGKSA